MQSLLDATQPKGRRYDCKSHGLAAVGPQAIGVPIDHAARIPSPQSAIVLVQLDGALGERPADHWPAGNRDAAFVLNVTSAWQHAADAVANCTGRARASSRRARSRPAAATSTA